MDGKTRFSIKQIIGDSGTNYGIGVFLDSDLLSGLTDSERKEMVKLYVTTELAGEHFVAYDGRSPIDIRIATTSEKSKNKKGKNVKTLRELYNKNNFVKIKQESVVLADELIAAATIDYKKPANYSHGWLDDFGKSDWEYWRVYIQEKNNSVWEATLNIANTANGDKVLYDIDPIKKVDVAQGVSTSTTKVGKAIKSALTTTNNNISNSSQNVNIQKQKKQSVY